jgi:hypothetical protein
MRDELMTSDAFFVPRSDAGYKFAAWYDDSTQEERMELFKTAVEKDTRDLAAAYNSMCNGGESQDAHAAHAGDDDDEDDDDDFGQNDFFEGDDDDEDDGGE